MSGQDREPQTLEPTLDRQKLKDLTMRAGTPQVYYEKGFELSKDDKEQLEAVVKTARTFLEKFQTDTRWRKLQELITDGANKGFLLSFNFPPSWLIDGGESVPVKKIKIKRTPESTTEDRPAIQVPTQIYRMYYWDRVITHIEEDLTRSPKTLHGTSPRGLSEDLTALSTFFKENKLI